MTGRSRKIAIVLPALRGGGVERLRIQLAKAWIKRGYEVEFVLLQQRGELASLLPHEAHVVDLGVARVRQVIRPLARYIRRSRPDAILAAMWPLTSASVIAWVLTGRQGRLFVSDHNQLSVSSIRELGVHPLFLKGLMRTTYPLATGILANSKGVKQELCRLGGLRDEQVAVVYNPAASGGPYEKGPGPEQLWGAGFQFRILSVGSLKPQKNHALLLRAFARIPASLNAKLAILGDGPLRGELSNLTKALGVDARVSMPGFVLDPSPWFRSADLFVLSSSWEGFGNVIVEALECGVPVVSTDCNSGPREILCDGEYGRLVPVNDVEALTEAIVAELSTEHDSHALVERSKDFGVEKIARHYLEILLPDP